MSESVQQVVASDPSSTGRIRRSLTRWHLILFGLVILSPTAVYPVYGIIQHVSQGQAASSYVVAMIAMLFTAASYGKMASVYPSAGSTYTYVQQSFSPAVGSIAGWAMILDYFLIPLESVIYSALTAQRFLPAIPYFVWVLTFTAGITIINVWGIRILARANTLMMAAMTVCAVLSVALAAHYVWLHYGAASLISPIGLLPHGRISLGPMMLGASIAASSGKFHAAGSPWSTAGRYAFPTISEQIKNVIFDCLKAIIVLCVFWPLMARYWHSESCPCSLVGM